MLIDLAVLWMKTGTDSNKYDKLEWPFCRLKYQNQIIIKL